MPERLVTGAATDRALSRSRRGSLRGRLHGDTFRTCRSSDSLGERAHRGAIDLRTDQGTSLLPADQIRARWDPQVQRISGLTDEVLSSLSEPVVQTPACETLLTDAEASGVVVVGMKSGPRSRDSSSTT